MTSLPLHPALVHLPLGLAFVLPVLAAACAWAMWTDRLHPRAWMAIVALQAVLLGAGFVAMRTGEREEDRVERIVPETALEQHEAYAEQFMWATGLTLLLAGTVLASRRREVIRLMTVATVAGTLIVTAAAIRVGHAGGRLVYEHNAGAAYTSTAQRATRPDPAPSRPGRPADGHEDER